MFSDTDYIRTWFGVVASKWPLAWSSSLLVPPSLLPAFPLPVGSFFLSLVPVYLRPGDVMLWNAHNHSLFCAFTLPQFHPHPQLPLKAAALQAGALCWCRFLDFIL
jgi:hypothetical protein